MDIRDLAPVAVIFIIAGITIGIGSEVTSDVKTELTAGTPQANVENATLALGKLAKWLPTIGLVLAAAIIIGVLYRSFMGGQR